MAVPKWNEEREAALLAFVGQESPVSQETVAGAAESLETSPRSVSSKLRKMGVDVALASSTHSKAFTDEEATTLEAFVSGNSGQYTYADIAEAFAGGKFSPKQIQGKVLSMELTGHVKAAPKVESVKTYTDAEEVTFIGMVQSGAFVEDIADTMGRPINSIRGKALSLLRSGAIEGIPKQRTTKAGSEVDVLKELANLADLTVEEVAESINKTVRGTKTMLTRRGLTCKDWDGAARKEKAATA
jgi:hypothetical protein